MISNNLKTEIQILLHVHNFRTGCETVFLIQCLAKTLHFLISHYSIKFYVKNVKMYIPQTTFDFGAFCNKNQRGYHMIFLVWRLFEKNHKGTPLIFIYKMQQNRLL